MSDTTTTEGLRKDAIWRAMERVVQAAREDVDAHADFTSAKLAQALLAYERVVKEKP
jgi:hypothetical protein